jgi:anti-sigma B factor antagonist
MTSKVTISDAGLAQLSVEGELDTLTVGELRKEIEKLLATKPKRVDVDLSSLRMLDSSGVGALVSLYKQVRAQGGHVVMVGLRDQPLAIFRLLRLDRVMGGADLAAPATTVQKESTSS